MIKSLITAGFFVAAVAVAPAMAQAPEAEGQARAVPVSYSDLDLSRGGDAAALLSRLRYAATVACERSELAAHGPALRRAIERCRTNALDTAVERIDQPELTRLHLATRR